MHLIKIERKKKNLIICNNNTMSLFEPNERYRFTFKEINNNKIIEKTLHLTFSEDNYIYDELYKNFDYYECYDDSGFRYVVYVDSIYGKYCCIKSDTDANDNTEYWFHNITHIHLQNQLIFTNLVEYCTTMQKIRKMQK